MKFCIFSHTLRFLKIYVHFKIKLIAFTCVNYFFIDIFHENVGLWVYFKNYL